MTSHIEEPKNDQLAQWELDTIEALAREAYEEQSNITVIWDPERWMEGAIANRQAKALGDARVRSQLRTQAQRLDVLHYQHPEPVADLEPLPTPDDTLAARWCRLTLLKLATASDHPWAALYHELVTTPVQTHRHTTHPWEPADEGIGILELLESEATHAGLIAGPPPEVDAATATHQMLLGTGVAT